MCKQAHLLGLGNLIGRHLLDALEEILHHVLDVRQHLQRVDVGFVLSDADLIHVFDSTMIRSRNK